MKHCKAKVNKLFPAEDIVKYEEVGVDVELLDFFGLLVVFWNRKYKY